MDHGSLSERLFDLVRRIILDFEMLSLLFVLLLVILLGRSLLLLFCQFGFVHFFIFLVLLFLFSFLLFFVSLLFEFLGIFL